MKKNTMMRIASVLMIAVLLTTCVISGTFAKYVTSDTGNDSARVAKWGVTVNVDNVDAAFAEKYDDAASATGTKVVSSVTGEDVLAPGTNGILATADIAGTPEVMVEIVADAELTLTGWAVDSAVYCPLVFTVNNGSSTTEFKIDATNTDTDKLAAAIEAAIEGIFNETVAANAGFDKEVSVTWAWAYTTAGNDANDTALGDLAAEDAAPEIEFALTITVTQVD